MLPISNSYRSSSAFARLRKATTTSVMYVCLSVRPSDRMEQLSSHWANIFDIWAFHENLSRKSRVSLKSDKNDTYFTRRRSQICDNILLNSTQNKKYFGWYLLRKSKQKKCSVTIFPKTVTFIRSCWKMWWSQRGHRRQYGACALHSG